MKKLNRYWKTWVCKVGDEMSDFHKETWSALFDGEASELELHRTLTTMTPEECARWQRYQWMRDAVKSSLHQSNIQISVAAAVAEAIKQEDVSVKKTSSNVLSKIKPFVGFATAASLAFVVVLLAVQKEPSRIQDAGFIASGNVSISQLPITTQSGLSTVSATVSADALQRQMDILRLQKQQDVQRIEYYLQQPGATNINSKPVMLMHASSKH